MISVWRDGDGFYADVTLENISDRDGQEVVQVYVRDPQRDFRALKGFGKTALAAGERRTVRVPLDDFAFSHYDADAKTWRTRKGVYVVSASKHALDEGVSCEWYA